jgi:hypothetical protein
MPAEAIRATLAGGTEGCEATVRERQYCNLAISVFLSTHCRMTQGRHENPRS